MPYLVRYEINDAWRTQTGAAATTRRQPSTGPTARRTSPHARGGEPLLLRDAFCSRSPASATAQKPPGAQGGASHKTPHRAPERKVCPPCYGRENVTVSPAPRQHGKNAPPNGLIHEACRKPVRAPCRRERKGQPPARRLPPCDPCRAAGACPAHMAAATCTSREGRGFKSPSKRPPRPPSAPFPACGVWGTFGASFSAFLRRKAPSAFRFIVKHGLRTVTSR
jgi:hypothetical protein